MLQPELGEQKESFPSFFYVILFLLLLFFLYAFFKTKLIGGGKRMNNSEVEGVTFKKCPICKKGCVKQYKQKKFFGLAFATWIACNECNAQFTGGMSKDEQRVFTLDLSNSDLESPYDGQTLKTSEWERGLSDVDYCAKRNMLPTAQIKDLKIIVQSDEKPHWYSIAKLLEERAVRRSVGGAVRIIKGVYVGGSQSESHGQLKEIDEGYLLLTNKRLIFNGNMRNVEYQLNKIVVVDETECGIEIAVSNKNKVQLFVVTEPHKWATYVKIAVKKIQNKKKDGKR